MVVWLEKTDRTLGVWRLNHPFVGGHCLCTVDIHAHDIDICVLERNAVVCTHRVASAAGGSGHKCDHVRFYGEIGEAVSFLCIASPSLNNSECCECARALLTRERRPSHAPYAKRTCGLRHQINKPITQHNHRTESTSSCIELLTACKV